MRRIIVMSIIIATAIAMPGFIYAQDSPAEKVVERAY